MCFSAGTHHPNMNAHTPDKNLRMNIRVANLKKVFKSSKKIYVLPYVNVCVHHMHM